MSIEVCDVSIQGDAWVKNRYYVSCIASRNEGKWFEVSFTIDRVESLPLDIKTIEAINNWILPHIEEVYADES